MSLQRGGQTDLPKGRFYSKLIPNQDIVGVHEVHRCSMKLQHPKAL